jgi:hypothetical protein
MTSDIAHALKSTALVGAIVRPLLVVVLLVGLWRGLVRARTSGPILRYLAGRCMDTRSTGNICAHRRSGKTERCRIHPAPHRPAYFRSTGPAHPIKNNKRCYRRRSALVAGGLPGLSHLRLHLPPVMGSWISARVFRSARRNRRHAYGSTVDRRGRCVMETSALGSEIGVRCQHLWSRRSRHRCLDGPAGGG